MDNTELYMILSESSCKIPCDDRVSYTSLSQDDRAEEDGEVRLPYVLNLLRDRSQGTNQDFSKPR